MIKLFFFTLTSTTAGSYGKERVIYIIKSSRGWTSPLDAVQCHIKDAYKEVPVV